MFAGRSSLFIPYNNEKKLLLQLRSDDAPRYPGLWGFFGGMIDGDETPEEALLREVKEELGLTIKQIALFKRYEIQEEDNVYERFVFLYPLNESVDLLRAQQREGVDLQYFSPEEIKDLKFNDYNRIIIRDVASHLSAW